MNQAFRLRVVGPIVGAAVCELRRIAAGGVAEDVHGDSTERNADEQLGTPIFPAALVGSRTPRRSATARDRVSVHGGDPGRETRTLFKRIAQRGKESIEYGRDRSSTERDRRRAENRAACGDDHCALAARVADSRVSASHSSRSMDSLFRAPFERHDSIVCLPHRSCAEGYIDSCITQSSSRHEKRAMRV
jgi:hypothetical protein